MDEMVPPGFDPSCVAEKMFRRRGLNNLTALGAIVNAIRIYLLNRLTFI